MSTTTAVTPSFDLTTLRECLGRFATGVTVVTCNDASGGACGITANSFSSVSLDPPLVLWNIARVSDSLEAYLDAEFFAINILGRHQRDVAEHFAQADHTRFDGIDYSTSDSGTPILSDTIACLLCRTYEIHECGDHYIIIGEVKQLQFLQRDPLVFFGGHYASLVQG